MKKKQIIFVFVCVFMCVFVYVCVFMCVFVSSLSRLVVKGYRTPLQTEDLWSLRKEDSSDQIISDLQEEWAAVCNKLQQ